MLEQDGMTLVEVMVAMALLAVFTTAALGALIQVARASEDVRLRTTAAALAWSRVERARNMDFDEIDNLVEALPGSIIDAIGLPDIDGAFRRRTSVNTITNGFPMKHVRVDVWPRDRRTNTFSGQPENVETVITDIPRRGGEE